MRASTRFVHSVTTTFAAHRSRWILGIVLVALSALTAGCRNKLTGSVTINGAAYTATSCNSGERNMYQGVEFSSADGRRLRVLALPTGQAMVNYFPPGASIISLGPCATLNIEAQSSTVNNIRNVRGNVTFACGGFATVVGNLTFENCH